MVTNGVDGGATTGVGAEDTGLDMLEPSHPTTAKTTDTPLRRL
jgi:hypothetical protein